MRFSLFPDTIAKAEAAITNAISINADENSGITRSGGIAGTVRFGSLRNGMKLTAPKLKSFLKS